MKPSLTDILSAISIDMQVAMVSSYQTLVKALDSVVIDAQT